VHIADLDLGALLPRALLRALTAGTPLEIHSARIGQVHVTLPTLSRKLVVTVDGVDVVLRQRVLPEVRSASTAICERWPS